MPPSLTNSKKKVTVYDVATKAGVSQGTVSVVLGGITSTVRVSEETRRRVMQTARDLGYQPNLAARNLARQRTDTIGLMISHLDNPFFVSVLREFEAKIFSAGYRVILDVNSDLYAEYQPLQRISSWMVDGVLIWTNQDHSLVDFLGPQAKSTPVVYLGHWRADTSNFCAFDLYGAGRQAAEHLVERGYRRIAYLSMYDFDNLLTDHHHQFPGIYDVCRESGVELEVVLVENWKVCGAAFAPAKAIAERPAATRPDAVICYNDNMAITAYNGLIGGGARVPRDIALVGFDGLDQTKFLPVGPLTTVAMPLQTICATALESLLRQVGGDRESPPTQALIPTELIVGTTT